MDENEDAEAVENSLNIDFEPATNGATAAPAAPSLEAVDNGRPTRKAAREAREATKKMVAATIKAERHDRTDDDLEEDEAMDIEKGDGEVSKKAKGKGKEGDVDQSTKTETKVKAKTQGKGNGKGKEKATVAEDGESDTGSDFGETIKPQDQGQAVGKKTKKPILAKAAYWKDIPKWKDGDGSYLMDMPAEIMDQIFGLRDDLGVSGSLPMISGIEWC
jgi:hypothetical protein